MHLAEFNIGVLKYDWDDPRMAEFRDNLDRVFAVATRFPGYVWHMSEAEMDAAQTDPDGPLGGNPRTASTLSVWRDLDSLERFVWKSVHRRFVDKKALWYDSAEQSTRLVMWWIPEGHVPTIDEAAERLALRSARGDSAEAFGWDHARGVRGNPPVIA